MAFSMTAYRVWATEIDEPGTKRFEQHANFTIVGTTGDIDMDIGDTAGLFWGAVDGDALGLAALGVMKDILSKAETLTNIYCFEIEKGFIGAGASSSGAGEVKYNGTYLAPEILFYTSEGLELYHLTMSWLLKPGESPVRAPAATV